MVVLQQELKVSVRMKVTEQRLDLCLTILRKGRRKLTQTLASFLHCLPSNHNHNHNNRSHPIHAHNRDHKNYSHNNHSHSHSPNLRHNPESNNHNHNRYRKHRTRHRNSTVQVIGEKVAVTEGGPLGCRPCETI